MHVLIVGVGGNVREDLAVEGDGDALGVAAWIGEEAVIVAAAAAEARAIAGEGEAGDEDEVEGGDGDAPTFGFGFPSVQGTALKVIDAVDLTWLKCGGVDLKETGTGSLRVERRKKVRQEIGLAFETTEQSDGGVWWPRRDESQDSLGDLLTGGGELRGIGGTKAFAHVLAKRGFVVHALG